MINSNCRSELKQTQKNSIRSVMKSLLILLTFSSFLLFSSQTQAQMNAQTPAPAQSEIIALTGGTIHTVTDGVIENGVIVFEDGVITHIGSNVRLPADAQSVDVTGKHIYPGFVDAYSRMGIFEIGAVGMTVDINEQGSVNPNVKVERAFNPESRHIGVARSAGVLTSITTPGGGLISGQSAAMKMDGWSWDEMTLKSGTGLIVNWPGTGDDYEENIQVLRDTFADARSYKKAKEAMDSGEASRHDLDSRWEAMIPVFEGDTPVVVNANEVRQIQDAITWAEEEDVRLIILGGSDAHLIGEHLSNKNIPVILTNVLTSPNRNWEGYDSRYALPAKLFQAGVQFAIAGAPDAANVNRLPFEAGAAAAYGLSEDAALRSLTISPAAILGIDDRVGSLEEGKDATLMITNGNPLEYETQIEQVYIQGRKSDMMDMHKQLYEKYREKVNQAASN